MKTLISYLRKGPLVVVCFLAIFALSFTLASCTDEGGGQITGEEEIEGVNDLFGDVTPEEVPQIQAGLEEQLTTLKQEIENTYNVSIDGLNATLAAIQAQLEEMKAQKEKDKQDEEFEDALEGKKNDLEKAKAELGTQQFILEEKQKILDSVLAKTKDMAEVEAQKAPKILELQVDIQSGGAWMHAPDSKTPGMGGTKGPIEIQFCKDITAEDCITYGAKKSEPAPAPGDILTLIAGTNLKKSTTGKELTEDYMDVFRVCNLNGNGDHWNIAGLRVQKQNENESDLKTIYLLAGSGDVAAADVNRESCVTYTMDDVAVVVETKTRNKDHADTDATILISFPLRKGVQEGAEAIPGFEVEYTEEGPQKSTGGSFWEHLKRIVVKFKKSATGSVAGSAADTVVGAVASTVWHSEALWTAESGWSGPAVFFSESSPSGNKEVGFALDTRWDDRNKGDHEFYAARFIGDPIARAFRMFVDESETHSDDGWGFEDPFSVWIYKPGDKKNFIDEYLCEYAAPGFAKTDGIRELDGNSNDSNSRNAFPHLDLEGMLYYNIVTGLEDCGILRGISSSDNNNDANQSFLPAKFFVTGEAAEVNRAAAAIKEEEKESEQKVIPLGTISKISFFKKINELLEMANKSAVGASNAAGVLQRMVAGIENSIQDPCKVELNSLEAQTEAARSAIYAVKTGIATIEAQIAYETGNKDSVEKSIKSAEDFAMEAGLQNNLTQSILRGVNACLNPTAEGEAAVVPRAEGTAEGTGETPAE